MAKRTSTECDNMRELRGWYNEELKKAWDIYIHHIDELYGNNRIPPGNDLSEREWDMRESAIAELKKTHSKLRRAYKRQREVLD